MKHKANAWHLSLWGILMIRALLVGNPTWAQGPTQSAPAASICVAVIEPEVSADLPPAERKALAGSLDTLLTESLAKQSGFVLVDRQALDKVLVEKAGKAGGLAKVAADEIATPLRPFWSAGVLVCSRLDAKAQAVIVEAVSAQTGQVLAGIYAKTKVTSAEDVAKAIGPKMESFGRDIDRGIARLQGKPLLEISGRLASGLSRLTWMVDDLAEAAGAKVAAGDKVALLVPRQAIATKEERLLRVMGLAEAHKGDAAAGLSPVPQIRLSFELADSAKTGVSFEKTPIRLKLSLRRGDERASETQINGEVGQWDVCRDKAVDWLCRQLAAQSGGNTAAAAQDDLQRAKQLAEEELSAVAQWSSLDYHQQKDLDRAIRARVARHALRAAHLDPSDEQAAYLVASFVDAIYDMDTKEHLLLCMDRAIAEMERYLDRFPDNPTRRGEISFRIGLLAHGAERAIRGGDRKKDDILRPPVVEVYPYLQVMVHTDANAFYAYHASMPGKRYEGSNFSWFGFSLIINLIPCIPDDKLDEEYEYWRIFYATKVDKILRTHDFKDFLNTRPAPWDLVDAAFQARRKDPQGVREAFRRLAKEFPPSQTHIWGGDQWTPHQTPMFLKAAGDPDWKTWRPTFTAAEPINIALDEMTQFMHSLAGRSLRSWDLDRVASVSAVQIVVPEAVKLSGRRSGWDIGAVESLFVAGKDMWLITPASTIGGSRTWNHIFVAEMKPAKDGKIVLDPVEVPWPPQDAKDKQHPVGAPIFETNYVTERDGTPTVWIGTKANGLARFDKAGGKWTSRWYTQSNGFPANAIDGISSCRSGAERLILLVSSTQGVRIMPDGSRKPDCATYVWTLNPETNEVKLLLDGSKLKEPLMGSPAAVTGDGKSFLLEFLGRGKYDLDVGQMRKFISSGISALYVPRDLVRGENGQFRLLQIMWDAGPEGDYNRLDELSSETFKPLPTSLGRSGGRYSVFPFPETQWVFGRVWWRSGDCVTLSGRWPSVYAEFARERGHYLWMGFSSEDAHRGTSRWLVAYRPAPPGATDWAAKDQWVGPFRVPDNGSITRMAPYGEDGLLLTTKQGMYVVDCRQAISQGNICSTEQWRSQYEKRLLAAGWKEVLPLLLESKKWDQAVQVLEIERKRPRSTTVGLSKTETHLNLWHAHLLARKGDPAGAIRLYNQVAERAAADRDRPAEVFASMNQIILLFHAARFQEMLDLCRRVNERFPQTAPERDDDRLSWYVKEARKKIAAGRPAGTRPAAQSGDMTVGRQAINSTARKESPEKERLRWYQDLFAVDVEGKWGYIDEKGKIVIEPVYEKVHCFSEGLAGVKLNGKYGFIDEAGKLVIAPQFRYAFSFREGLAWVEDGANGGFIDKTGRIVLHAPAGTYCREFRCGLAETMSIQPRFALSDWNEKVGFIDKTGKYAIKPRFDGAWEFSEDLAAVLLDGKWGFVDKADMIVIQPQYEGPSYFQDGIAAVQLAGKTIYINKTGKPTIPKEYDDGNPFTEGLAGVKMNGKWGFIDKTGAIVIEPRFDEVSTLFNGRAGVIVNKKFGYIDKTGKIVVELQYDYGHFFLGELANVWFTPEPSNGAGRGYVNRSGQVIWKPRPKAIGNTSEPQRKGTTPPTPPAPASPPAAAQVH